ncbi:MAG: hypothetical protein S4CHLAM37_12240 [Chlamydiia bacterium]|nr:hypothetical protein [Chlamydiia bacterium]
MKRKVYMTAHADTQVTAVSSVGSTAFGQVQEMTKQQVLQDVKQLIELFETSGKSLKAKLLEDKQQLLRKIVEKIVKNIESHSHSSPSTFGSQISGKLNHLCNVTTNDVQKIVEFLDNPSAGQNNNGIEGVHLDTTQNSTDNFDPKKYHALLTSIRDQINSPTQY